MSSQHRGHLLTSPSHSAGKTCVESRPNILNQLYIIIGFKINRCKGEIVLADSQIGCGEELFATICTCNRIGLVYWGLTPQQQPGSYLGSDDDEEMSVSLLEETGAPGGNHRPPASNSKIRLTKTSSPERQS